MTVEYSSSRTMLWRWYWKSLLRGGPHTTMWLGWMLGIFLGTFSIAHLGGQSYSRAAVTGLAATFCLAIFFAGYPQLRFKPQRRILTLLPDKLSTTIRGETKEYTWKDVARFEEDGAFLVIGLRNLNSFIVPPTAFRDERERQAFGEQGRAWWRGAALSAG